MSAGPTTDTDAAASAAGARSLADDIRGRTDEQLTALVLSRPDLARPAPSDLTSLAARAGTRASVQRAVESLDLGHLQVLEAVVVAGDGSGSGSVDDLMGGLDVRSQLQRLWDLALAWRAPEALYAVRTAPEVLGAHPAGLGPSSLELGAKPLSPGEIRSLVAEAPESARGVLDRLTWGPPVGVVNRDAPGSDGVRWLLDQRLLHVITPTVTERARGESETRVLLPREVALLLRGGRLHESVALTPPDADTTDIGPNGSTPPPVARSATCWPSSRRPSSSGVPPHLGSCAPAAWRSATCVAWPSRSTSTPREPPGWSRSCTAPVWWRTTARSFRSGRPPRSRTSGSSNRPGPGGPGSRPAG